MKEGSNGRYLTFALNEKSALVASDTWYITVAPLFCSCCFRVLVGSLVLRVVGKPSRYVRTLGTDDI